MNCPACGSSNLPGVDRCIECLSPLSKLDIPLPTIGLQKRLMEDTVAALNPRSAITVSPETSVQQSIQLLKDKGVGCVLIIEGDTLTGIFSERDVLYKLVGKKHLLHTIQTKKVRTPRPVTLNLDDSIRFALHQMSVGGFRHIPIVSPNQPLRIISARDVLGYVCQLTNTSTS